jgi:hypothetical protein
MLLHGALRTMGRSSERSAVVFGFFKRLREQVARPPAPVAAPEGAETPPERDERPGKSWYASSLDLHDGLDVKDADPDTTVPLPLSDK